jgi:hypothetical protein
MFGLRRIIAAISLVLLAACATPQSETVVKSLGDVARLEAAILALGDDVDPEEAARAARIAFEHTAVLKREYRITDSAIVHNMKVNAGLRPRGLCWHWAEDIENRLAAEQFETLELHRAIANADNPILLDHSTAIVSAKGDAFDEGIVLDPWRYGGTLFWSPLLQDTRYEWVERSVVFAQRRATLR